MENKRTISIYCIQDESRFFYINKGVPVQKNQLAHIDPLHTSNNTLIFHWEYCCSLTFILNTVMWVLGRI